MATGPKQPDAPKPDPGAAAPAVKLGDCPNCGRPGVAVFPVVHPDKPKNTPRLVCPYCCPKTPADP
jgi:hypothetical protein